MVLEALNDPGGEDEIPGLAVHDKHKAAGGARCIPCVRCCHRYLPGDEIAYGHLDLPTEWKEVLNERAGIVLLEVTIVQNRGKIKRIDRVFSEQREELKVLLLVLIPNS